MNSKLTGSLFGLAAVFLICFAAHADQIVPNPNEGTIVVSDPYAYNSEDPFVNNGEIDIEETGILYSHASMTNNGALNNSGTFNNFFSRLSNSGTLNNSGSFTNAVAAMINTGTLKNTGNLFNAEFTMDNYGVINNAGAMKSIEGTTNNYGIMNNTGAEIHDVGTFDNAGALNNTGALSLDGNLIDLMNSGSFNNSGALTLKGVSNLNNSGTLKNTGALINNAYAIPGEGVSNSGTLSNTGAITGTGNYLQTAGETINNGVMRQNSITIQGGSLSGTGVITGVLNIGGAGMLSPGDPVGTLTINGDLISSGDLLFRIGGLNSGQFSALAINGNAVFNGGEIGFNFMNGFSPAAGEYWYFLTAAGVSWDTVRFQLSGLGGGLDWGVDLTDTGAMLSIRGANSLPEPSTLTLLAAGLTGLLFWTRRRRPGHPRRAVTASSSRR